VLNVGNFMSEDSGQGILRLTAAKHAASDHNQPAGSGKSVDFHRVCDLEVVAAERLRPVRGLGQSLAHHVDVMVEFLLVVRAVLG